jgi:hypothetical protein
MTPAQKALSKVEIAWSEAIRTGCAPDASSADRKMIGDFLQKTLDANYRNIDHLGTVRTKKQDIDNCVKGYYQVTKLTTPKLKIRVVGNKFALVSGKDEVQASFKGDDGASGKFLWTDAWVKVGKEWKCIASHGSKL